MVEHKCKKCGQIFNKKSTLDDHLKRKNPCDKGDLNLECQYCHKRYSRRDSLNRHLKTMHTDITVKNCVTGNNSIIANKNNNSIIANNNSNITVNNNNINQFFLLPFGIYKLDDLTTTEKIAIFSSKCNPIEMIIIKTHLDPDKDQYHNCGITDIHSGFGIIHDGGEWRCWRISDIMNTLIESGQENSLKIYNKIKHFFQDDVQKSIEHNLDTNQYLLRPRNNHFNIDIGSKKNLIAHLKSRFYNQRELVEDAMIKTKGKIIKPKNDNTINILKDGVTIEDIDIFLKKEKKSNDRIITIKQMCHQLLNSMGDKANHKNKKLILEYIEKVTDITTINIVFNFLSVNYVFNKNTTYELLMDKIKLNDEMKNIIK